MSYIETLKSKFGDSLKVGESVPGEPEFRISNDKSFEFIKHLKTNAEFAFEHLADITSYDKGITAAQRFKVVYVLISMSKKQRATVVVDCAPNAQGTPAVKSLMSLWSGADWLEREVFDLMGVVFEEHTDLRRILLPPTFQGHPLQKDFAVDYRQEFDGAAATSNTFTPFSNSVIEKKDLS